MDKQTLLKEAQSLAGPRGSVGLIRLRRHMADKHRWDSKRFRTACKDLVQDGTARFARGRGGSLVLLPPPSSRPKSETADGPRTQANAVDLVASTFRLSHEQYDAVSADDPVIRIIACAGSGKTQTIACRIARLLLEGTPPEGIVAFTFTDRAASELKERVRRILTTLRVDRTTRLLSPLFIGTIHGYCNTLLQTFDRRYAAYDIIDDHRQFAFLLREKDTLGLGTIHPYPNEAIDTFLLNVSVLENELIDPSKIGPELQKPYRNYLNLLDSHRYLTFGQLIAKAVELLRDPATADRIRAPLRHLIVDEYQDINPAQDHLIRLLAAPPVHLCVVGDDDQCIYQWRGSDVSFIRQFPNDDRPVRNIVLGTNYRSRPNIITFANRFAQTIQPRLDKTMQPHREPSQEDEVVLWEAEDVQQEAERVAETIQRLHCDLGYNHGDIAILLRSVKTSAGPFIKAFKQRKIPFVCGGHTSLFAIPKINLLGRIYAWLVDRTWTAPDRNKKGPENLRTMLKDIQSLFTPPTGNDVQKFLEEWKKNINRDPSSSGPNLVKDFQSLLRTLGVSFHEEGLVAEANDLGTLARFSQILEDFEHAYRRVPFGAKNSHAQTPFNLYQQFHYYLRFYAKRTSEGYEGMPTEHLDAVSIVTVHQAKGLEWPVVFIPCLIEDRFPPKYIGKSQTWLMPHKVFPPSKRRRYEGTEDDERRLLYVAITRGRDIVYLSRSYKVFRRRKRPSPFWEHLRKSPEAVYPPSHHPLPLPTKPSPHDRPPTDPLFPLDISDILLYSTCGLRYHISRNLGFVPPLDISIGYGKAAHHILSLLIDRMASSKTMPTDQEIKETVDRNLHLPFAPPHTLSRMRRKLITALTRYLRLQGKTLLNAVRTERPFTLLLDKASVTGRADLVLEDASHRLHLVDYKTAHQHPTADLQLQLYALAAMQEGSTVASAQIHGLVDTPQQPKDVETSSAACDKALKHAEAVVDGILNNRFPAACSPEVCKLCDHRILCRHNPPPNRRTPRRRKTQRR